MPRCIRSDWPWDPPAEIFSKAYWSKFWKLFIFNQSGFTGWDFSWYSCWCTVMNTQLGKCVHCLPLSANVYSDITSGLGSKSYPKMILEVLESAYWFLSYGKVVFHCQLTCTVTSWVDWAQKSTLKWLFKCWNLPTGSWIMVRSSSIVSWHVQGHHEWTGLKKTTLKWL